MAASLEAAPLQMRDLTFNKVYIEPNPAFEAETQGSATEFDWQDVDIQVSVGLGAERDTETEDDARAGYFVHVEVTLPEAPQEGQPAPYQVSVDAYAWFSVSPAVPPEKRQDLVSVNGASLILGAIREQVANITARSRFGMLALPTLRFIPEANNSTD